MTKLMEKALSAMSGLPEGEQEEIAAIVIEELASEKRWSSVFAQSQDLLAAMADEALQEFEKGETLPLESDCDLTND